MIEPFHIQPKRYTIQNGVGRIEIDAVDFFTPGAVIVDCVTDDGESVATYSNQSAWMPGVPQSAILTHRNPALAQGLVFPPYLLVQVDKD